MIHSNLDAISFRVLAGNDASLAGLYPICSMSSFGECSGEEGVWSSVALKSNSLGATASFGFFSGDQLGLSVRSVRSMEMFFFAFLLEL